MGLRLLALPQESGCWQSPTAALPPGTPTLCYSPIPPPRGPSKPSSSGAGGQGRPPPGPTGSLGGWHPAPTGRTGGR